MVPEMTRTDGEASLMFISAIDCNNPNSSLALGMARTLRAELRQGITVVEMNVEAATIHTSSKSLVKLYQNLSHRTKAGPVDPDYEYAIFDGDITIPRIRISRTEG